MRVRGVAVAMLVLGVGCDFLDDGSGSYGTDCPAPSTEVDAGVRGAISGPFVHFAIDRLALPTTPMEAAVLGFDLDGACPARPDNALGNLAETARGQDLDVACDADFADGTVVLLASIQAEDLGNGPAGWHMYFGDKPREAPRFDGTDIFAIDSTGPTFLGHDASYVTGGIVDGRFTGMADRVQLVIPVGCGQPPIRLSLVGARIDAEITDSSCTGRIGGGISSAEIHDTLVPALARRFSAALAMGGHAFLGQNFDAGVFCLSDADCPDDAGTCPSDTNRCTCGTNDCQGELAGDGVITANELYSSHLMQSLLAPDVDLLDSHGRFQPDPQRRDGRKESLSLGLGISCVKATFGVPGEP